MLRGTTIFLKRRTERLAIIGIHPPPYGGVGVHLKRMLRYLDEKTDMDFVFYNTGPSIINHPRVVNVGRSVLWYIKMLAYSRHQVIHAHTGTWWVRIALGFLGLIRNYKTVFTAHSYSFCDDFLKGNFIRRWLQKFILRRASKIIAVNHIIRNELLKIGVPEKTIHIIPAFIPPLPNSGDKIPEEVLEFCKNRSPILTANGAFVLRNGDDIYGLEIMVNMMESLPRVHPNAALVIYIGGTLGSDENLFKKLISRIASGTLKSHILFYRSEEEFYPVLNITDVFLRPTLTDGDAVSLREALYFGVPVVCSDAVSRPEGVAIFSTKDISAFIKTLNNVLANLSDYRDSIRDIKFDDNGQKIYQLITKLFSSK